MLIIKRQRNANCGLALMGLMLIPWRLLILCNYYVYLMVDEVSNLEVCQELAANAGNLTSAISSVLRHTNREYTGKIYLCNKIIHL